MSNNWHPSAGTEDRQKGEEGRSLTFLRMGDKIATVTQNLWHCGTRTQPI
jgi:hypothetical protein